MISLTNTEGLWTQPGQAGAEDDDPPICCWNICTGITTGKTPRPPRPLDDDLRAEPVTP